MLLAAAENRSAEQAIGEAAALAPSWYHIAQQIGTT
jgi:hypothetical protein